MTSNGKCHILVVEDNPGDVNLLRMALKAAAVDCDLTVIMDGQEAIAYIQRHGESGASSPDLAILDLNVPRNDGLEILEVLRASAGLANLPVVILTSSSSPSETAKLHQLGISRHITKPLELEEFLNIGAIVKEVLATGRTR